MRRKGRHHRPGFIARHLPILLILLLPLTLLGGVNCGTHTRSGRHRKGVITKATRRPAKSWTTLLT